MAHKAMQTARAEEEEERAELITFSCKLAYIYLPLPPAPSYGHRAELWDVDKWFREVKLKVVAVGDLLYIRLKDLDSDELFAECPLPADGSPLTRAVEPVVDSSRYYVLKVVDRDNSKMHAFVGLGFRERSESSAFSAALDNYRQYLRRKAEAAQLHASFTSSDRRPNGGASAAAAPEEEGTSLGVLVDEGGPSQRQAVGQATAQGDAGTSSGRRYALSTGQTISVRLPNAQHAQHGASAAAVAMATMPSSMLRASSAGNPPPRHAFAANSSGDASSNAPAGAGACPWGVSNDGTGWPQLVRVFSLTEGLAGWRLLPPPPPPGTPAHGAGTGAGVVGAGDRALSSHAALSDWAVFADTVPKPTNAAQLLQGAGSSDGGSLFGGTQSDGLGGGGGPSSGPVGGSPLTARVSWGQGAQAEGKGEKITAAADTEWGDFQ